MLSISRLNLVSGALGSAAPIPTPAAVNSRLWATATLQNGWNGPAAIAPSYETKASSYYSQTDYPAYKAFAARPDNGAWASPAGLYSTSQLSDGTTTYAYSGSSSTTVDGAIVQGEWVQLHTPTAVSIVSYTSRVTYNAVAGTQVLVGSQDGATWTALHKQTNAPQGTSATYTLPAATPAYSYFRYIVTQAENLASAGLLTFTTSDGNVLPPVLQSDGFAAPISLFGSPMYSTDSVDNVCLRGILYKEATSINQTLDNGSIAFVLGADHRPPQTVFVSATQVLGQPGTFYLTVKPDGTAYVSALASYSGTMAISLDGISFSLT